MTRKGVNSLLLVLLAVLMFGGEMASSQTIERPLQQLNHRVFTAAEGAPMETSAIAQTPDGILWVGGRGGLARFDGIRFVPYPQAGEQPLRQNNVASLFVTPDGGLWIGFRPGGVSLLKNGRVVSYGERDGLPIGPVAQFALDREGGLWAAARAGLARLYEGRWQRVAPGDGPVIPYGVMVDRTGTIWSAGTDGLFARAPGESRFRRMDHRSYSSPWALLAGASDGGIWAAADNEFVRVDSSASASNRQIVTVRGLSGGPLLADRAGGLWGASLNPISLLRVPAAELANIGAQQRVVNPEKFNGADGLRSGRVYALLEDRENNIWVGTNDGLHRFSHSNVVRDELPSCTQGVTASAAVSANAQGSLWMACWERSRSRVDEVRNGRVVSRHDTPVFTATSRDHEGTIWFAGPTHFGEVQGNRIVSTPLPDGIAGRPASVMLRQTNGALWLSFTRKSVFRFFDGQWSEYGGLDGLPRGTAFAIMEDSAGDLWFGYTENRIARVQGDRVQVFDAQAGLEVGTVMSIIQERGSIWVGGELGFARFDGKRFIPVRSASGEPFRGISGVVNARNGDLWLNGSNGIVHVTQRQIDQLLEEPSRALTFESFDYLDGVPGPAVQLGPLPTAIEASDGKIWFATTGGVVSIDATHLSRNALPPPVTIWSVTSNANRYANLGADIRLPVHTTDLQIQYSAGSLTVPERVRFRYKLEGSDSAWQDVGTRREAVYTNLRPGNYSFRVSAANNDGVWNETGAAIRLSIAPAFYQTNTFYGLCALACLGVLTLLYKLRMHQVATHVRGRLEARLAERERIARELHDTLLQGVQGLIWRFQAVTDTISSANERRLMEEALDRADRLLAESRDRVKDLRPTSSTTVELADALAAEGEQLCQFKPAKFAVSVQGALRELHPLVREECLLIAREALLNAFQHARATNIEVELIYGSTHFQIVVRDDGEGIDQKVLSIGARPAHFGLVGMRERTKKLGAHLDVWSKQDAGTEVDLRVPANVAYRKLRSDADGVEPRRSA
ncbi:MAG TPA: two-component regulator propeller domain-containing protein [Steroidobacter sp.]